MTENELLSDRQTGVGGSDIASVLGVGYGCALRLFRSKTGQIPDYPRKESGPMELGKLLEPWIADKFAARHSATVQVVDVKRDEEHPHRLVHADRVYRAQGRPWGVLEIKALGARVFLEMKRTGLAVDYGLQLQWGIQRYAFDLGSFAVCNRDTGEIADWEVTSDKELCDMIDARVDEFWANVQAGNAPERLDPDDSRCQRCEFRRTCQGNALIHIDAKADIEQDESMRPLMVKYSERKKIYEEAEESLEIQKAMIKDAMGDRVAVIPGTGKIYFRPQTPNYWDDKAMASDISRLAGSVDYDGTFIPAAPAVVEGRYKKPGKPFRALRVYE